MMTGRNLQYKSQILPGHEITTAQTHQKQAEQAELRQMQSTRRYRIMPLSLIAPSIVLEFCKDTYLLFSTFLNMN